MNEITNRIKNKVMKRTLRLLLSLPLLLLSSFSLRAEVVEGSDQLDRELDRENEFDREIEEALNAPQSRQREREAEKREIQGNSLVDWANTPRILVAVDMLGDWNLGKNNRTEEENEQEPAQDRAEIREVEFGFNTAIDHLALGTVLFAVHNEEGDYFVELHEAYFEFNRLPWNLFLKLGIFFLDVGSLNSIHRHDWKFSKAPLVHRELFDEEAVSDFGGELSFLMPWPFYQEVKIGIFNGEKFGHVHGEGMKKPNPLYTGRIKHFFLLGDGLGSRLGFTYMRYNVDDDPDNYWQTGGLDLSLKWQRGRSQNLEWSNEFWYRNQKFAIGEDRNRYGYYSSFVYQPFVMWRFGLRWDNFIREDDFDGQLDKEVDKNDYSQSIWVDFRPSEYSYFRLTVERQDLYAQENDYLLLLQADFILGYHPPHRY